VETPDEIGPAIAEALGQDGPYLIDLVLRSDVPGHEEAFDRRRTLVGTRFHHS
jgi:thiamine pyrophosphate-dependent acetolactate synthase large subunit-like protein